VSEPVQRWTTAVVHPNNAGGFVAYGDYLTLERQRDELAEALAKINEIRNSIIGLQTINWSEHIYPLVAALNDAGFEGMPYDEARGKFGTMLERTVKAETARDELAGVLREYVAAKDEYRGFDWESDPPRVDRACARLDAAEENMRALLDRMKP
jgi:hypothetical protein